MQTIRKAGPDDLIALVWFQLGYRPRDSVVLVGLEGPRRRTGLISRIDLDDVGGALPARGLVEVLARTSAQGAVVLVASEDPRLSPWRGQPAVVRTIRRELRGVGISLVDALWVGAEGYRSYLCRDPQCCPLDGYPLAEVMSSSAAAASVLDGQVLAPDEAGLVADVLPGQGDPPAGQGAGERPDALPAGSSAGLPATGDLYGWLRLWRRCLAEGTIDPIAACGLAATMDDDRLRDAVMLTFLPTAGDLPEALLEGGPSLEQGDQPDGTGSLDGAVCHPPDPDLLGRATALLAVAARTAPAGSRAPALACLAWVAWWAGVGARARMLTGLALADRPGYGLATLVDRALVSMLPPPWVSGYDRVPQDMSGS